MNYNIREVSSSKDRNTFIRLLEETGLYGTGEGAPRFEWFYARTSNKAFLLTTQDGKPIGTKGYGIRPFVVNGEMRDGAISVDVSVIKEYRNLKPAIFLHKETAKIMLNEVDFLYGIPNKNATPIYKRTKILQPVYRFDRFAKILNMSDVMGSKAKLAQPALNFAWRWSNKIRQFSFKTYVTSNEFVNSQTANNIKQQNCGQSICMGVRDVNYLTWRYLLNPSMEYKVFSLVDNASLVYFEKGSRVYIVDLIWPIDSPSVLFTLLSMFEQHCISQQRSAIIVAIVGSQLIAKTLKQLWYKQFPQHESKVLFIGSNNEDLYRDLTHNGSLFFMFGDEDAN